MKYYLIENDYKKIEVEKEEFNCIVDSYSMKYVIFKTWIDYKKEIILYTCVIDNSVFAIGFTVE